MHLFIAAVYLLQLTLFIFLLSKTLGLVLLSSYPALNPFELLTFCVSGQ